MNPRYIEDSNKSYLKEIGDIDQRFRRMNWDDKISVMLNLLFQARSQGLQKAAVNATISFITKRYLSHVKGHTL